jgi:V-type H+-transporting ATPase subunit E
MHSHTSSLLKKPLSDNDANREVRKMTAFILQEANEKAVEIRVRADEEYNMEKAKIYRQEKQLIEETFTRKLKQAGLKRKVYYNILCVFNPCLGPIVMP